MNGLLKKALTVVLSTTMLTSTIPSGNVSTVVAQGYDIPETYGYVEQEIQITENNGSYTVANEGDWATLAESGEDFAGETIVLPSGDELDLNMMITLNDTGKFLWERLEIGAETEELVSALLAEYDVDEPTAKAGVERFVNKLNENGFLE